MAGAQIVRLRDLYISGNVAKDFLEGRTCLLEEAQKALRAERADIVAARLEKTPLYFRQPNSRDCFVCGLKNPVGLKLTFYDDGVDQVRCEYAIPAEYQGYPGVAHGGIVAAILDEVVGRVAMIGDHTHFMMTVKMEIKYRQPVPVETPLVITGKKIKIRGRLGQARGEVLLPGGEVAAEAQLTLADLPEAFRIEGNLEELGWKVYP